MATFNRTCPECGTDFVAQRRHAEFCKTECKTAFNNRRFTRGAVLYDFFMATRYERGLAKQWGAWTDMCALAFTWRREDAERRGGRRSWGDWRAYQNNNPWLSVVHLGRFKTGLMK